MAASIPQHAGKAQVIKAVISSVQAQMAEDRKTTALKSLQVSHQCSPL